MSGYCPYCHRELPGPPLSEAALEVFGVLRDASRPMTIGTIAIRARLPWRTVAGAVVSLRRRGLAVRGDDESPVTFAVAG